jgi:hypothetical protein
MNFRKIQQKAGYTHKITWQEKHKQYGTVTKSFPTTKDAVQWHLSNMKTNPDIINAVVERI